MIWLSAVFVVIGGVIVWLGLAGDSDVPLLGLVGGMVCLPMGIGCGIFFFGRLIRPRPELVLTDEGIEHRQSGTLTWGEVSHVRLFVQRTSAVSTIRYVQVGLHDPAAYFARSSRWIRLLAKTNQKLGFGTINYPESMLGTSAEQVIAAMRSHHPTLIVTP